MRNTETSLAITHLALLRVVPSHSESKMLNQLPQEQIELQRLALIPNPSQKFILSIRWFWGLIPHPYYISFRQLGIFPSICIPFLWVLCQVLSPKGYLLIATWWPPYLPCTPCYSWKHNWKRIFLGLTVKANQTKNCITSDSLSQSIKLRAIYVRGVFNRFSQLYRALVLEAVQMLSETRNCLLLYYSYSSILPSHILKTSKGLSIVHAIINAEALPGLLRLWMGRFNSLWEVVRPIH